MTKTKQVLALLSEGQTLKARAIAARLGWDMEEASQILAHMKRHGYITTPDYSYSITDKGQRRAAKPPSAEYERRKEVAKSREIAQQTKAEFVSLGRDRANSVFNLGARACS